MSLQAFEREVRELHTFFGSWFSGSADPTELSRLESALAASFRLVSPEGRMTGRAELIAGMSSAHGSRQVEIDICSVASLPPDHVGTYEEWQRVPGEAWKGRLTTAVMEPNANAPNGLAWVWVQETWLPDVRP